MGLLKTINNATFLIKCNDIKNKGPKNPHMKNCFIKLNYKFERTAISRYSSIYVCGYDYVSCILNLGNKLSTSSNPKDRVINNRSYT